MKTIHRQAGEIRGVLRPELEAENERLRFMVENGLDWTDMDRDDPTTGHVAKMPYGELQARYDQLVEGLRKLDRYDITATGKRKSQMGFYVDVIDLNLLLTQVEPPKPNDDEG